jgi:hypothetical protein
MGRVIRPSPSERRYSETAGFGPGATPTVDGVTFTMPAANPDGTDNVMANAQTIPLPTSAPALASNIDLLAVSTCGDTNPTTAKTVALTINYDDGDYRSDTIPRITDWLQAPPSTYPTRVTLAATLPYRDVGTTPDRAHPASIYHLHLTNSRPSAAIQSITLPNLGSTFTGCTNPTLHILTMTTS